jgi:hypothetical protein
MYFRNCRGLSSSMEHQDTVIGRRDTRDESADLADGDSMWGASEHLMTHLVVAGDGPNLNPELTPGVTDASCCRRGDAL